MTTDRQTDLSKQRIERTHATRDMSGRDHFVLLVYPTSNTQNTKQFIPTTDHNLTTNNI